MRTHSAQLFHGLALLSAVGLLAATAPSTAAQTATSNGRTTGANNPALRYFGGGGAAVVQRAQYQQPITPTPVQPPANAPTALTPRSPRAKPFSQYRSGPTISPYLALDYINTSGSLPNYYAYVRPQQQQQQQQRQAQQQAQTQRLQGQFRTATAAPGMPVESYPGSMPSTGHSAQFLNSGSYFPRR